MGKLSLNTAEQARVQLTQKQQKQIEQIYKGVAKDIDQRIKKIPNVSSAPLQKYYLENLKKQVLDELNKASSGLQDMIEGNMKSVAESVLGSTLDFAQKIGLSVEGLYSHVPDEIVKAVATGQLYEGDWTLSKAIWKDHMKTQYNVNTVVAKGIAENKSAYDIAKDLEKYVDPSAEKPWDWSKVYPGVGKKIDYNAQRLARTMVSHAYQQAFVRSTIKNPFVEMYRWDAANSGRVCPICADRDGQLFSKSDLPLDHPNGMCTFEAVIPDSMEDIADRVADWAYGADDPELDTWAEDLYGTTNITPNRGTLGIWREDAPREITSSIDRRFSQLMQKYPVSTVKSYGDMILVEQQEWDRAFKQNLKEYLAQNPKISEESAREAVLKLMTARPTANESVTMAGAYNAALKSIRINTNSSDFSKSMEEVYKQRQEYLAKQDQRAAEGKRRRGFSGLGMNGETTLIHEYGHAISEEFNLSQDKSMRELFNSLTEEERSIQLSRYGSDDIEEFIAEGFSESQLDDARELSRKILHIIEGKFN